MSTADAESLLERLADLDVRVAVHGDELELRGPPGSIGAELREEVRANRAGLIRLLLGRPYAAAADQRTRRRPELFTGKGAEPAAVVPTPKRRRMTPIIETLPEPPAPRARPAGAPRPASKHHAIDLGRSVEIQDVRGSVKEEHVDLARPSEDLDDLVIEVAHPEAEALDELTTPTPGKRKVGLLDRIIGYPDLE